MLEQYVLRKDFAAMAGVTGAAISKACNDRLSGAVVNGRIDITHESAIKYLQEKLKKATNRNSGIDELYTDVVMECKRTGQWEVKAIMAAYAITRDRAKKIVGQMQALGVYPADIQVNHRKRKTEEQPTPPPEQPTPPPHRAKQTFRNPDIPPEFEPHVRGTHAAREQRKWSEQGGAPLNPTDYIDKIADVGELTLFQVVELYGTESRFIDWLGAVQKIHAIQEKSLKNAKAEGTVVNRDLVRRAIIDVFNSVHLRLLKDGSKTLAAGIVSKFEAGAELPELEEFASDTIGSFIKQAKHKTATVLDDA